MRLKTYYTTLALISISFNVFSQDESNLSFPNYMSEHTKQPFKSGYYINWDENFTTYALIKYGKTWCVEFSAYYSLMDTVYVGRDSLVFEDVETKKQKIGSVDEIIDYSYYTYRYKRAKLHFEMYCNNISLNRNTKKYKRFMNFLIKHVKLYVDSYLKPTE